MLRNKLTYEAGDRPPEFEVYIHEKGQFWQRPDMHKIGQPDRIELDPRTEMEVSFENCIDASVLDFTKKGGY